MSSVQPVEFSKGDCTCLPLDKPWHICCIYHGVSFLLSAKSSGVQNMVISRNCFFFSSNSYRPINRCPLSYMRTLVPSSISSSAGTAFPLRSILSNYCRRVCLPRIPGKHLLNGQHGTKQYLLPTAASTSESLMASFIKNAHGCAGDSAYSRRIPALGRYHGTEF